MHKKYHKKFKILDIPAATTQAREGIETEMSRQRREKTCATTQAREGIETHSAFASTYFVCGNNSSP